ncbi:MAG: efflux RND transporter periplasmic adaptor subunit [Actinobacteria bacterium]|nr:efflux RND transporter periplasmic adaptor subunit [Actinomycetota bacterium]MBI3686500.1 efflux RND transporter periplasmic adaptor subunit [Actinomycetota bacterium]
MRRWIITAAVAVVAVGSGVWLSRQGADTAETTYLTATAQRGDVVQTVAATGTVQPKSSFALQFGGAGSTSAGSGSTGSGAAAASAGQQVSSGASVVRSVAAVAGRRVTAGAELATVDSAAQDSQLAAAQAQLDAAQTALSADQTDGASDSRIASDEAAVAAATSTVTRADAAVAATRITAPVAGLITAVKVSVGVPPPPGAVIELRSDTLVVVAEVAEQDVVAVKANQAGQLTFPALGVVGTGTVTGLPTAASPTTTASSSAVTFPVTLTLKAPPAGLLPGMSAQVTVTIGRRSDVLQVPTTAIQGSTSDPSVQVMVGGVPQTRPVVTGMSTEQRTEIVSGLNAGDVVVTGVVNPASSPLTTGGGLRNTRVSGGIGTGGGRGGN